MSFSSDVKNELNNYTDVARHCCTAELAALFLYGGVILGVEKEQAFLLCDNPSLLRKCFTLAQKSYIIKCGVRIYSGDGRKAFLSDISDGESLKRVLRLEEGRPVDVDGMLVQHSCCKRAFLRGGFLAVGSMSDPAGGYHLEFVCATEQHAAMIRRVLGELSLEARIIFRKDRYVVYLKEGAAIVELLGIMGAHVSLMELENLRILKEMRGSINRRVNCETANITKTVTASSKQIEDIILIRDSIGLKALPPSVRDIAVLRLDNPDIPLKELGERLTPPLGKSGVNHRLRKLSRIAEEIRGR